MNRISNFPIAAFVSLVAVAGFAADAAPKSRFEEVEAEVAKRRTMREELGGQRCIATLRQRRSPILM